MTDAELMIRIRADDTAALDELVDRYWRPLVNYVADVVSDWDTAHDIAQEAFVRLWQRRQLWDPRGSVGAWLFRTGRNLGINEHRRRRVRAEWAVASGAMDRPSRTPLQDAEDDELRAAVAAALEKLAPRRREALRLFYLCDFTYREIAEIMGIQPQSVANHLQAALADLRTTLGRFRPPLRVPEHGTTRPPRPLHAVPRHDPQHRAELG